MPITQPVSRPKCCRVNESCDVTVAIRDCGNHHDGSEAARSFKWRVVTRKSPDNLSLSSQLNFDRVLDAVTVTVMALQRVNSVSRLGLILHVGRIYDFGCNLDLERFQSDFSKLLLYQFLGSKTRVFVL